MSEPAQASEGEDDFEDLFENAPCGYLCVDPAGVVVRINRTLAGWLGGPGGAICGRPLYDLLPIGGRMYFETHLKPLLRMQGFFNEVALELLGADAARLPVIANGLERRDPQGRLLSTRITLFLAIERRRYERNLRTAQETAEAAGDLSRAQEVATRSELDLERSTAELREQFIAVLGHDLRNPLASIVGAARLLRKEALSPRGLTILDLMNGSVARMGSLIDNVLDFARGRLGGGVTLTPVEEPLEPLLRQVVAELTTGVADVVVETDFDLQRPVRFDRSRMGQMISNLLGNAITYGAAGRPVRICARSDHEGLRIDVINDGDAIPEAAMSRLFQPFFRGEVRRSQQGLGLGLYIAAEIAKAHGGALDVVSSADETRFTFRMPPSAAAAV